MDLPSAPSTSPSQEETISRFRAKVSENPANELFRFSLGKALFDAARWDEAREHLEAALAKRPDWMVVCMLLARLAQNRHQPAEARDWWKRSLDLAIAQHHEDPEREIRDALAKLESS
jgi:uncharacterized protein HemY